MNYSGVNILVCDWLLGQGLALFKKLIIIKLVRRLSDNRVHIPSTCQLIQHELRHTKQMWIAFTFWLICLYQYAKYGHKKAPYEIEAREAESAIDGEIEKLVLDYCKQNNLLYYY